MKLGQAYYPLTQLSWVQFWKNDQKHFRWTCHSEKNNVFCAVDGSKPFLACQSNNVGLNELGQDILERAKAFTALGWSLRFPTIFGCAPFKVRFFFSRSCSRRTLPGTTAPSAPAPPEPSRPKPTRSWSVPTPFAHSAILKIKSPSRLALCWRWLFFYL